MSVFYLQLREYKFIPTYFDFKNLNSEVVQIADDQETLLPVSGKT